MVVEELWVCNVITGMKTISAYHPLLEVVCSPGCNSDGVGWCYSFSYLGQLFACIAKRLEDIDGCDSLAYGDGPSDKSHSDLGSDCDTGIATSVFPGQAVQEHMPRQ